MTPALLIALGWGLTAQAEPPETFRPVMADPIVAPGNAASPYGRLTSAQWAWGAQWERENLAPVPNPHPSPEPQPTRAHPFDVALSTDGSRAYVALQGSELEPGHSLAVYDIGAGEVRAHIRLSLPGSDAPPASSPYRLKMHTDGRHLLVTARLSNFMVVVDTHTDQVVAELPLDFYGQGMALSPDGGTLYVADRYLDQVLVVDITASGDGFAAAMRPMGGADLGSYAETVFPVLQARCGDGACHGVERGGLLIGDDPTASFPTALTHLVPGDAGASRLVTAGLRTRDGGYADRTPSYRAHAGGVVPFPSPTEDAQVVRDWVEALRPGPGIPVGNPRSKPKVLVTSADGRHLFVGNTGTQDITIVDTALGAQVGGIYIQNVVNDLATWTDPATGAELLFASTLGVGFGVVGARDPYGGETMDAANPAAQYSVWRDPETGEVLPRADQAVLGPYDAVDGTAALKFRDIQNDLLVVDLSRLDIPAEVPADGLRHVLRANRYEAHRSWVRYTSDTAESTWGDVKGDIPPELMRVVGAQPEKLLVVGDRLFVTMQASAQVQQLHIQSNPADPADRLVPERVFSTGLKPVGIAAGPVGSPAEGQLFVANFLGGTLSIIDVAAHTSREVLIDESVLTAPVPATNAERGELVAHTAAFSSDGDTACSSCHYLDMGDGRPWGVSQVVGQEFPHGPDQTDGDLVIGGTMGVPQMRALFDIQPFFFEGVLSAFEPRSMLMEHAPADDFADATPQGDFTHVGAHTPGGGTHDVQSRVSATVDLAADLEARRDAFFGAVSQALFGKAATLRDLVRYVGEWQISEPRLLPNPFDADATSVARGEALFRDPQVGCVSCHAPPAFTRKDLRDNPTQVVPPQVITTRRDTSFTLLSMNKLDEINGVDRDLEPADRGRAEGVQGQYTTFPLRGLWDRPPVFLHNGMARSLREVCAPPGHPGLRTLPYATRIGDEEERPNQREVGFNTTWLFAAPSPEVDMLRAAGGRLGFDTHGGTSQLNARQLEDLVHFLEVIE